MAFAALMPILVITERSPSPRSACGLGLLTGFCFYYIELFWITNSIAGFTSLPTVVVTLVMALLALYIGLYFAIFCGAWHYLNNIAALKSPLGKVILALSCAAVWLLLEDLRSLFLGGFPWHPLGLSQIDNPFFNWLLPFGGVRLLSGLIVIGNVGIYRACQALCKKSFGKFALYSGFLLMPLVCLALFGNHLISSTHSQANLKNQLNQESLKKQTSLHKRIVIIQPNIPQKEKWHPENRGKIINKMLAMSQESCSKDLHHHPDLIVWPEAALPLILEKEPEVYAKLYKFVTENQVSIMLGGPRYIRPPNQPEKKLFNAIFLISPEKQLQIYDKIKLVPYGEFTPLATLFPFISKIVPGLDYSPGNKIHNLNLGELKIAPSVCFEGVFPAFTASFFAAGANLLINLTNDAWFGDSPGPRQHLANIRLRALENRCTIIRCANTGISAVINPAGKIEQLLPLNQEGIIFTEIAGNLKPTFFARHPHLATGLAGLYLLLPLGLIYRDRRKTSNSDII